MVLEKKTASPKVLHRRNYLKLKSMSNELFGTKFEMAMKEVALKNLNEGYDQTEYVEEVINEFTKLTKWGKDADVDIYHVLREVAKNTKDPKPLVIVGLKCPLPGCTNSPTQRFLENVVFPQIRTRYNPEQFRTVQIEWTGQCPVHPSGTILRGGVCYNTLRHRSNNFFFFFFFFFFNRFKIERI